MKRLLLVVVLIFVLSTSGCKATETEQKVCVAPPGKDGWYEFTNEKPMKIGLSLGDLPAGTIALIPSQHHDLQVIIIQPDGYEENPIVYGYIPEIEKLSVEVSIEVGNGVFVAQFEVTRCGNKHYIRVKPSSTDGTSA